MSLLRYFRKRSRIEESDSSESEDEKQPQISQVRLVSDQESNDDEGSSQFCGDPINDDNDEDGELIDDDNDTDSELIDDDDAENAIQVAASTSSHPTSKSSNSKRSSRFRIEWLTGRSWLKYDRSTRGMTCNICQKHCSGARPFKHESWIKKPCTRLRLESIIRHEECESHITCVRLERLASKPNVASAIHPVVPAQGIEQAIGCLYFIAKRRLAHTTNFEPILDLASWLGVEIKSKIRVARNAIYTSHKSIQEMLYVISELLEKRSLDELKDSEHFALMFDETTDCTTQEQLAIHGRYIDNATGELKCTFLKVVDLLQPEVESAAAGGNSCIRAGAETITRRIEEFIEVSGVDRRRLRGIGTDGASTMVGCRNGVVARLKRTVPTAVGVHCAAHRLNLASTQASKAVPYVKAFDNILRQIFDFFDNSAVRTAGLEAIQALLHEKGKMVAPCATRWLSIERSVSRLKACFASVSVSLQREAQERHDARALGINAMITKHKFITTMLLMCDALPHVPRLSKIFQHEHCDYSSIPGALLLTKEALKRLKTVDGMHLRQLPEFLEKLKSSGIVITRDPNDNEMTFTNNIKTPYLSSLLSNIEKRFEDQGVMTSFTVFNPDALPLPDSGEEFAEYGNGEIEKLFTHFHPSDVDEFVEESLEEWSSYKERLAINRRESASYTCKEVLDDLCGDLSTKRMFPKLSSIACICRVIPMHTASVERTFSQLNLIKTDIRNGMSERTLDALLRIAVNGPSLENFPVKDAAKLWALKKNRRLSVK